MPVIQESYDSYLQHMIFVEKQFDIPLVMRTLNEFETFNSNDISGGDGGSKIRIFNSLADLISNQTDNETIKLLKEQVNRHFMTSGQLLAPSALEEDLINSFGFEQSQTAP